MKLLIAVALLLLTSFAAQGQNQQFLFVTETAGIEAYTINGTTGALVAAPGNPFTDPNSPVSASANPAGTFLFVANSSGSVSVFAINQTSGALAEISGSPFPTGSGTQPAAVAVSNDGNYLYLAASIDLATSSNSGQLDIFSIAADGSLTLNSTVPSPAPPVVAIVVSATTPFIYVCGGSGVVQAYSVSGGTLTQTTVAVLPSDGANSMVGNGTFLFVARMPSYSQNGYIDSLSLNPDGTLSIAAIYDAGLFNSEAGLAISQGYLFSSQNTYEIAPNGDLTPTNQNWINGPYEPLAASSTAPFLFQGDQAIGVANGPLVFPFVVASDGSLTNAEPPLFLHGIPSAMVVATGTTPAPSGPAFVFEPATFNFSPVTGGQTSLAQLTIYSTGSVPLTISNIAVAGSAFSEQSSTCPATLAPSQTCFVYVNFAPSAAGTFTGTLNLTGNASGTVPLTGIGDSIQVSTVGAGSVQQVPLGSAFAAGTAITLTATPNSGATFSGWTGACSGAALTCALTLTANSTVTATFATATPPPTPKISITPQSQTGTAGETFTFTITSTGFSTPPQLTVSCAIPKGSCTLSGTILTVATTAPSTSASNNRWLWPLGIALLALACLPRRTRKTALVVATLAICGACGSSAKSVSVTPPASVPGTPAGSYSVVVAATGSTATGSAGLTIQ